MKLKVGLGQIHLLVGVDEKTMQANIEQMRVQYKNAKDQNCDVVLFPELAITGYSPEDLLVRLDSQIAFTKACNEFKEEILSAESGPTIIFGSPRMVSKQKDGTFPQGLESASTLEIGEVALANSALVLDPKTKLSREVYKMHLPNWGVFDEVRVFGHARKVADTFDIAGVKCGVVICRDIWIEDSVRELAKAGAKVVFVPNASPYANSRSSERIKVLEAYSKKYGVAIVYVNMIEGCDELVFDGGALVTDSNGVLVASSQRFEPEFLSVELDVPEKSREVKENELVESVDLSGSIGHDVFDPQETYKAIILGTREFIDSVGEDKKVCIGLSGGIDSALVAAIAVDALGSERVHGVMLPSKFTSQRSIEDAQLLANNLGITSEVISIEKLHETATVEFSLDSLESIVSENIQSRLRGLTLMMLSNSKNYLVLATSNKSESAVGYCTLYGDTVGAWSPIKDVYKTQVYELCSWRNASKEYALQNPIPMSIIEREPTAELRHGQSDEESLYPYEILDGILELFIDHEFSASSIVERGFDSKAVDRVINLVKSNEFKRKQTPPGPRLTRKNFGRGRRVPICAHW